MLNPDKLKQHAEAGTLVPRDVRESATRTYPKLDDFERNWDTMLPASEAYEYDRWRTALAEDKSGKQQEEKTGQDGEENVPNDAVPTGGEIFVPQVQGHPGTEVGFSGWQTHTGETPK